MLILHLSDLHLTAENKSFDDIWPSTGKLIQDYLKDKQAKGFDFIMISGDLSQKATQDEYDKLEDFSKKTLLQLLKNSTATKSPGDCHLRRRIIFVPGNHDVDWGADIFEPIQRSSEADAKKLSKIAEALTKTPGQGDIRLAVSEMAHIDLMRIKPESYSSRFKNVNAFLKKFYGKFVVQRPLDRNFDLIAKQGGYDWSAHVFEEERIAFIGLSSCHRNDKYWHGAGFESKSIVAAQAFIRDLKAKYNDMIIVGVWHHGFSSDPDRPDRLTIKDVGTLYNLDIDVGFHGHTHKSDLNVHKILAGKVAIVATGSLGAGSQDVPGGETNQFGIVEIEPPRMSVRCFRLDPAHGVYTPPPNPTPVNLFRGNQREDKRVLPKAKRHVRTWKVYDDGVVDVHVDLNAVQKGSDPIPLAVVSQPYCRVVEDPVARVDSSFRDVQRVKKEDGRIAFTADFSFAKDCSWECSISNTLALQQADLAILPLKKLSDVNFNAQEEEAHGHVVRIETEELELRLEFPEGLLNDDLDLRPRALVERKQKAIVGYRWEVDHGAVQQAELGILDDKRTIVMKVKSPVVDSRYSIVFRPPKTLKEISPEALRISRDLLARFRGTPFCADGGSARLSAHLEQTFRALCSVPESEPLKGRWVGFLWDDANPDQRRLRVGFGNLPVDAWSAVFAAGNGVAGHCFRHGFTVAWKRASAGSAKRMSADERRKDAIFQEHPEHYEFRNREFDWLIAWPLLVNKHQACIGVVGAAGFVNSGAQGTSKFEAYLRRLVDESVSGDSNAKTLNDKIQANLNNAFWLWLVDPRNGLDEQGQAFAQDVLADLLS